ncbi:MAG TPA: hypothetical protein VG742_20925, partial [Dongiaceae bacterium]|nr:hypothetical protein [Dongiaceae bacterium]
RLALSSVAIAFAVNIVASSFFAGLCGGTFYVAVASAEMRRLNRTISAIYSVKYNAAQWGRSRKA